MKRQFLRAYLLYIISIAICLSAAQAQNNPSQTDSISALQYQFAGKAAGSMVLSLAWKPVSEAGVLYFELQRSIDGISFIPVLLMQAKGAIKKPNGYTYTDTGLLPDCYFYRLRIENFDGQETYSPILQIRLTDSNLLPVQTGRL